MQKGSDGKPHNGLPGLQLLGCVGQTEAMQINKGDG